jgi:hypothetical protein
MFFHEKKYPVGQSRAKVAIISAGSRVGRFDRQETYRTRNHVCAFLLQRPQPVFLLKEFTQRPALGIIVTAALQSKHLVLC